MELEAIENLQRHHIRIIMTADSRRCQEHAFTSITLAVMLNLAMESPLLARKTNP